MVAAEKIEETDIGSLRTFLLHILSGKACSLIGEELSITFHFDGSGDDGYVDWSRPSSKNDIPNQKWVDFLKEIIPSSFDVVLNSQHYTIDVSEYLAYLKPKSYSRTSPVYMDLLENAFEIIANGYDWYNNDGGFGSITLYPDGSLSLDMNIRYMDHENHSESSEMDEESPLIEVVKRSHIIPLPSDNPSSETYLILE